METLELLGKACNRFTVGWGCGILFTILINAYFANPRNIEKRGRELNLFHYDAKLDKFVPNDTIKITSDEFHYLEYGDFK